MQHQLNEDDAALASVGRMPQAAFDQEQNDPSFLVLIGSIYQAQHQFDRAQRYLERAMSLVSASQPGIALQLADIYAGPAVGIQNISSDIPSSYKLSQNYPNPFNPVTNIAFDIPKSSLAVLRVYDMLGREVAMLVNDKLEPGS